MTLPSELIERKLPCGHTLKFVANSMPGLPHELAHQKPLEHLSYYEQLLEIHHPAPKRLLEIGICQGGSLALWPLLFDSVEVVGVDYNTGQISKPCRDHYQEPGQSITVIQAMMPSPDVVRGAPFDFIIDDGGHGPGPAIKSFDLLWPRLSPGGLYVIEDWGTYDLHMKDVIFHLAQKEVGYWPGAEVVPGGIEVFHVWRQIIGVKKSERHP